jgi:hypothetical protein
MIWNNGWWLWVTSQPMCSGICLREATSYSLFPTQVLWGQRISPVIGRMLLASLVAFACDVTTYIQRPEDRYQASCFVVICLIICHGWSLELTAVSGASLYLWTEWRRVGVQTVNSEETKSSFEMEESCASFLSWGAASRGCRPTRTQKK